MLSRRLAESYGPGKVNPIESRGKEFNVTVAQRSTLPP